MNALGFQTMTANIDPNIITPLHGVRSRRLFGQLRDDMKANGWNGLPLLVIETETEYVAWTGSHRIAAAVASGLELVPCYVIPAQDLTARGHDPKFGHVEDWERLKIIREVGDTTAIHIMWSEGRS